jgi:hypothetical protein
MAQTLRAQMVQGEQIMQRRKITLAFLILLMWLVLLLLFIGYWFLDWFM